MRYNGEKHTWVPYRTVGDSVEIVTRPPTVWVDQPYFVYLATAADTMQSLAFARYGMADAYWLIADMNPRVECPDDMGPGDLINIPIVS